ncbi:MAG: hypothetical protein HY551_08040, partial [Elusimicrobia bacterium]|nr:hypothetical protein [Elusimicrobiota bacterium]
MSAAAAAGTAAGYVVKTDSDTVYLDQGEGSGARAGQEFTIFVTKGELQHPVTGESLGFLENPVAQGRIYQVLPKYSLGRLLASDFAKLRDVKPGQRVRLKAAAAAPPPTAPAAASSGESSRQPVWRSPALDLEAVGLTLADVDGDAKTDIVLADSSRVIAYP